VRDLLARLREIAAGIVEHYQSDLEHDERLLSDNPDTEFVWIPYRSGTRIVFLTPHWREYGFTVHEHFTRHPSDFQGVVPYLGDPKRGEVKAITFEQMLRLFREAKEPVYEVHEPDFRVRYESAQAAAVALEQAPPGSRLVEAHSKRVLAQA